MSADQQAQIENHVFEADVARLLHMMVHSVYSDKDVFLRELISNAADACEKLRYEAIEHPSLLAGDGESRITLALDEERRLLTLEDNGIGMTRDEMIEALGTIARSGTRAFMERLEANKAAGEGAQLIGQFGVGFYSSFMVAARVDVVSRRAGAPEAWLWSSDGKGSYEVSRFDNAAAPARGTQITLHLLEDAKDYASRWTVERIVKQQSGHVPVAISLIEKPGSPAHRITDGSALWTKSRNDVSKEDYSDFYRGLSGQHDDPALTIHFRAEGRHEYTVLAFVPGSQPYDMSDAERKGRMKLYVKRVFITDDAELLPRYLRFVRGLVDTSDLPLNVSREMIQESPILTAIRKGVTNRVLSAIEKLVDSEPATFAKLWEDFGAVIKEGLYDDFERRAQLLALSRFRTTASGDGLRSLDDYVRAMKAEQNAIYYLAGGGLDQLRASPQLEGFRARGIEVLLLTDAIDSFWVMQAPDFVGKTLKSVTQGTADLSIFPSENGEPAANGQASPDTIAFIDFARTILADQLTDVRTSDRLTESAVCLVAPETGYDRQIEKILQGAGRIDATVKPILEINSAHPMVASIVALPDTDELREAGVRLLLDQAHILDGDKPSDPRAFAERLALVFARATGQQGRASENKPTPDAKSVRP